MLLFKFVKQSVTEPIDNHLLLISGDFKEESIEVSTFEDSAGSVSDCLLDLENISWVSRRDVQGVTERREIPKIFVASC